MTDEVETSKVKDLAKEREKRKPKLQPEREGKIPVPVLFQAVSDAINRKGWSALPPFPQRFALYAPSLGGRTPVGVDEGQVLTVLENNTVIDAAIMEYCNRELGAIPEYRWAARTVEECRRFWFLATEALTDASVARVRWRSEPGPCFNRLPWDWGDNRFTPTWDRLLARMTNAQAFREWVGSLFFDDSDNQQYVWLHGQGGDGKGAINRFLARVFGNAFCSKQVPNKGDKFWTYGLIGKRLVTFPDCNEAGFVSSGLFKSLTGDDPIDVERKGQQSFTYRPRAKYLFFSNEKPRISSEHADVRRVIYCAFEAKAPEREDGFEDCLWEEGGAFLTASIEAYMVAHPKPGTIACATDEIDDWLSTVEEEYEDVFSQHFGKVVAPWNTVPALAQLADDDFRQRVVLPSRMQEILKLHFKGTREKSGFLKWLEVTHAVKKTTVRRGRLDPKVYVGIGENSGSRKFADGSFRSADGSADGSADTSSV